MVKESITSTAERTNEVEKEQEGEKVSSLCLTEKGLDLHGGSLVMANTDNFQEESFSQCVQFCMEAAPELNHVLISYYNALIVGDKVNCSNFFSSFSFRLQRANSDSASLINPLHYQLVLGIHYSLISFLRCICNQQTFCLVKAVSLLFSKASLEASL